MSTDCMPAEEKRPVGWGYAWLGGSALILLQLGLILAVGWLGAAEGPEECYRQLFKWDSGWYAHIIDNGYLSTLPPTPPNLIDSNVAFAPGYPVVAGLFGRAFGLPTWLALVVVAQLCSWGLWIYLLLIFRRWRVPPGRAAAAALAMLAHPAAFFLVSAYSESLFLMTLLGFIYWSGASGRLSWLLAAVHGLVMTATRLIGAPLAVYPLLSLVDGQRPETRSAWLRKVLSRLLLCAAAALGALSFFAYCQVRWGIWDLYMQTQRIGWQIDPDYLIFLRPRHWHLLIPPLRPEAPIPHDLSRYTLPVTLLLILGLALAEKIASRALPDFNWRGRAGLYFCGAIMLYFPTAGLVVAHEPMQSMIRYGLGVHLMMVMGLVHLLGHVPALPRLARVVGWTMFAIYLPTSLGLQVWCLYTFSWTPMFVA
jgi:hypothetical protein